MNATTMKLSDLIAELCRLDRARGEHYGRELRKRHPDYDERGCFLPMSAYDGIPPPPQTSQMHDLLRAQAPATIYMLIAIWRAGRGDFRATRRALRTEYLEVGDNFRTARAAADYLPMKQLCGFFNRALEDLAKAGVDVDGLLE